MQDSTAHRPKGLLSGLFLLGGFVTILGVLLPWQLRNFWDHTIDDAAITFAYLETWVAGHGLAIRPGEPPVEAYSNALWLLALAPFEALKLDLLFWSKALSATFAVLTAWTLTHIVRRTGGPLTALIAPMALLGAPLYGFWIFSGLENALFGLMMTAVVWRALEDTRPPPSPSRWAWLLGPLFQALTVICRPDGIVLVCLTQLYLLFSHLHRDSGDDASAPDGWARARLKRARPWIAQGVVSASLYLSYAAAHFAYFQQLLPNSFKAKSPSSYTKLDVFDVDAGGWLYLKNAWTAYDLIWVLPPLIIAGLAARPTRRPTLLFALLLGACHSFCIITGGDWMLEWRFVSLYWPVFAALIALGCSGAVYLTGEALASQSPRLFPKTSRLSSPDYWRAPAVASRTSVALGLLALVFVGQHFYAPWTARAELRRGQYRTTLEKIRRRNALFMTVADRAGLHTIKIADPDMGGNTWRRPVAYLDLGRLADLSIPAHHPYSTGYLRDYVFYEQRPDVFHLHGSWRSIGYQTMREFSVHFKPIRRALKDQFKTKDIQSVRLEPFLLSRPARWRVPAETQRLDGEKHPAGVYIAHSGRFSITPHLIHPIHSPTRPFSAMIAGNSRVDELPKRLALRLCEDISAPQRRRPLPPAHTVEVRWSNHVIASWRLVNTGWVTGLVHHPLPPTLATAPCLALTLLNDAKKVIAVTHQSPPTPADASTALIDHYLERLKDDPRLLLLSEQSPLAPPAMRWMCQEARRFERRGGCLEYNRTHPAFASLRDHLAARGVEHARPLRDSKRDVAAALWLIGARESAGNPPVTGMGAAWLALAEEVAEALYERARGQLSDDIKSDSGRNQLLLSIALDTRALSPRLYLESIRRRWSAPLNSIEDHLRQRLLRPLDGAKSSAQDIAHVLASYARTGDLLDAFRCLEVGPCRLWRKHLDVSPWATHIDALLDGAGSPRPPTQRVAFSFEDDEASPPYRLVGDAFGPGPVSSRLKEKLEGQRRPTAQAGMNYFNSFHGGTRGLGRVEFGPFEVEDDFVAFLSSGGVSEGVRVELVIDGEVAEVFHNPAPTEVFNPGHFDLRRYLGQTASLRVIDEDTLSWGHIGFDALTLIR